MYINTLRGLTTFSFVHFFLRFVSSRAEMITYGSVVQLIHPATKTSLFSEKFSWGSRPEYQIVTSVPETSSDENSYWIVKHDHTYEIQDPKPVLSSVSNVSSLGHGARTGSPVPCNAKIRLEHFHSHRSLFSNSMSSVLTPSNAEVSAFGDPAFSEKGNDFIVECLKKTSPQGVWTTEDQVRFRHVEIGRYLVTSSRAKFTSANCPRCPVIGHQEVSIGGPYTSSSHTNLWKAKTFLSIENLDEEKDPDEAKSHDEL